MSPSTAIASLLHHALPACTACLGAADSDQTRGMNAAVLFLLSVVLLILVALALAGWRIMLQEQRNQATAPSNGEAKPC